MEVARMARGGPELLNDPVAQQLLASTIPARIAYVWRDGSPRITSLWFHWTGTDIVFATFKGAPKLNALHTGDQVALTIDTETPPNHLVTIRGAIERTDVEGVIPEYAAAAARYLGRAAGEHYIGSLPKVVPMTRLAVRPRQVVVLDFETRFPAALRSLGLAP
jgi:hypothetical protein